MFKTLFRKIAAGFVIGLGLGLGALTMTTLSAATVPLFTGPVSPSNIQAYLNILVNAVNAALAPGGTGTVPSQLALIGGNTNLLQFLSTSAWTSATSNCRANTGGSPTNTVGCLVVQDLTGTVVYIPVFGPTSGL